MEEATVMATGFLSIYTSPPKRFSFSKFSSAFFMMANSFSMLSKLLPVVSSDFAASNQSFYTRKASLKFSLERGVKVAIG